jgi:hypothetical protein
MLVGPFCSSFRRSKDIWGLRYSLVLRYNQTQVSTIEQLQFTGDESTSTVNNKIKLSFNHPVKELIFVVQPETFTTKQSIVGDCRYGLEMFNFTDDYEGVINSSTMDSAGAQINEMPGVAAGGTFNTLVPVYFGSGQNPVAFAKLQLNGHDRFAEREGMYFNLVQPYQHHENVPKMGVNVYSFCLKPEEHQPLVRTERLRASSMKRKDASESSYTKTLATLPNCGKLWSFVSLTKKESSATTTITGSSKNAEISQRTIRSVSVVVNSNDLRCVQRLSGSGFLGLFKPRSLRYSLVSIKY